MSKLDNDIVIIPKGTVIFIPWFNFPVTLANDTEIYSPDMKKFGTYESALEIAKLIEWGVGRDGKSSGHELIKSEANINLKTGSIRQRTERHVTLEVSKAYREGYEAAKAEAAKSRQKTKSGAAKPR